MQDGTKDAYSGYVPAGDIWGIRMMHESGMNKLQTLSENIIWLDQPEHRSTR